MEVALDLDSLYGRGPGHAEDTKFYADALRLKIEAKVIDRAAVVEMYRRGRS